MFTKNFQLKKFYTKTNRPYYDASQLVIHIRGHIRDSFNTPQLYLFLKNLRFTLKIYIHTWNVKANNVSWEKKKSDETAVTEEMVRDYFKDLPIVSIMIENDQDIELIGDTTGYMFSSTMPKIGWKNMWHGMYKGMTKIYETEKDNVLILNIRFDVFTNCCKVSEHDLMKWIRTTIDKIKYQKISTNYLIKDVVCYGIDNQMIGDKHTLYTLIYKFHHHLHVINEKYNSLKNQELVVFYENLNI